MEREVWSEVVRSRFGICGSCGDMTWVGEDGGWRRALMAAAWMVRGWLHMSRTKLARALRRLAR